MIASKIETGKKLALASAGLVTLAQAVRISTIEKNNRLAWFFSSFGTDKKALVSTVKAVYFQAKVNGESLVGKPKENLKIAIQRAFKVAYDGVLTLKVSERKGQGATIEIGNFKEETTEHKTQTVLMSIISILNKHKISLYDVAAFRTLQADMNTIRGIQDAMAKIELAVTAEQQHKEMLSAAIYAMN